MERAEQPGSDIVTAIRISKRKFIFYLEERSNTYPFKE
jgi:hypothetical protein